jgi:hypothetical protein
VLSAFAPTALLFAQAAAQNSSIQVSTQADQIKASRGSTINLGAVQGSRLSNASVSTDIKAKSITADNGAKVEIGTVTGNLKNMSVETHIDVDDIKAKKDLSIATVTVKPKRESKFAKDKKGQKFSTVTVESGTKVTEIKNTVGSASNLKNMTAKARAKKYEKTGGVSPGGTLYDHTTKKEVADAQRKGESAGNTTIVNGSEVKRVRKATNTTGE